ncbi:MAG TPA: hybrid sensor histidine kinase/response regulator [Ktedonobacter sp.]|nr:hybrid sensor histidine kinase/response regulator [Ktedonobacter sp.]
MKLTTHDTQQTPHILIVDDDTALLEALPQALYIRIKGIRVDVADSAGPALALAEQHDYDAIVSDIKMPGIDGLTLLKKLQEQHPETPILLITGHGEHDLAVQALRGGAYDFIQKPIDRDYFVAALRRAIQTRQLRRRVQEQQRALELHAQSLEQQVQERTRELLIANAAKDEFLSVASHELKTPLSSLKGMTQLLRRRFARTNNPELENVISMERSVRRMELLIQDLLSTSLVETGMLAMHPSQCNLVELCRNVIKEYVAATHPPAIIQLEVREEVIEVELDEHRISQALLNLLSNAYKYSPRGASIIVTLKRTDHTCTISVHDQGEGILPENLPRIFERFYRVPDIAVQTGSSFGLGLGLYIAHKIIEQHGGTLSVESRVGEGSTFTLELPLTLHTVTQASDTSDTSKVAEVK